MRKFKVKLRVVEVRDREYTIYASDKEVIHDLVQAINFDILDYDDEKFVSDHVDEVLKIEEEKD